MNRRTFSRQLSMGAAAWWVAGQQWTAARRRLVKPARLQAGQTVGLISPASYISDEKLEKAVTNLESIGLKVQLGQHIRKRYGSFAGTDQERLADLHAMFIDPAVDAIWCARGGYGLGRLLPLIDYRLIRKNPKVLVGYSDVTALHLAIHRYTGLVTFHGPVGSSVFTDYARQQLAGVLFEPSTMHTITLAEENIMRGAETTAYRYRVLRAGIAQGPLTGGNLSLLAAAAGTPYAPNIKGHILFVEDIGESPYRIDRMLTTLRQAWPLEEAAAIVLGTFHDCEAKPDSHSLSLQETIDDRLGDLPIPVVYGFSFGHIDSMCTLPMGIEARLDTGRGQLQLLEAGVC
jgi:muramoyltetrapeptide carboxypeptidase